MLRAGRVPCGPRLYDRIIMSEPQTRASVLTALKAVVDPELQRDVVSLGLVKDLTVDGGRVSATLELMTHGSPYAGQLRDQVVAAVRALPGITDATVALTAKANMMSADGIVKANHAANPPSRLLPRRMPSVKPTWLEAGPGKN